MTENLPKSATNMAKKIMDHLYQYDRFRKIEHLFSDLDTRSKNKKHGDTIKIETPENNLGSIFVKQSSDRYIKTKTYIDSLKRNLKKEGRSREVDRLKPRVFEDVYQINLYNQPISCRLTYDWINNENPGGTRTSTDSLIRVVNQEYAGIFSIEKTNAEDMVIRECQEAKPQTPFHLSALPMCNEDVFARRYITALLAKPFAILTGNSGTGKTRIARRLAKVLACDAGGTNSLVVPVGADWTDNTRLLGFFNPLAENGKGRYVKTQVVELIEHANDHPDIPFFLILDEMNLSHVERYFADFLSHMEMPDSVMQIDGYGELRFPANLFVTGTVNIDETTYMFSPKVLDRANVIEFAPAMEDVMGAFDDPAERDEAAEAEPGVAASFCAMAKRIRDGVVTADEKDIETAKEIWVNAKCCGIP